MPNIFTDNFDSYSDGDLNTQGDWSGATTFDIQGTTVQGGTKAVQCADTNIVSIRKIGTQQTAGSISIYMRRTANNDGASRIYIKDGDADANQLAGVNFSAGGNIESFASGNTDIGDYVANTWYKIDIEWHSTPSHQVRFRVDDGTWSSWQSPINDWTTGPDRVQLYVRDQTTTTTYWDTVAEAVIGQTISVSESPSFTESFKGNLDIIKTESVNFTEVLTTIRGLFINVSESISFVENLIVVHTINWINQAKNAIANVTGQTKNNISPTNQSKNNANNISNQDKS